MKRPTLDDHRWIEVPHKYWDDLESGMWVREGKEIFLIGDANECGGGCNCCALLYAPTHYIPSFLEEEEC